MTPSMATLDAAPCSLLAKGIVQYTPLPSSSNLNARVSTTRRLPFPRTDASMRTFR